MQPFIHEGRRALGERQKLHPGCTRGNIKSLDPWVDVGSSLGIIQSSLSHKGDTTFGDVGSVSQGLFQALEKGYVWRGISHGASCQDSGT